MDNKEILKRYYRGETTVEEERTLRAAYRSGALPDDPVLAFGQNVAELPAGLEANIRTSIRRRRQPRRLVWLTASGIAAMFVLILSVRSLLPDPPSRLQLSDNLKKERFEQALRVIGNVLEEKQPPVQKVLYEDNKLIIAVE